MTRLNHQNKREALAAFHSCPSPLSLSYLYQSSRNAHFLSITDKHPDACLLDMTTCSGLAGQLSTPLVQYQ